MPPTLKEIARQAGVAKSTVSMTLRNQPQAQRFSEQTRQRIFEIADQLQYRPNFFATSLSSARPKMLMLGVSHLADTWASRVAAGFEEEAARLGYRVLLTAFHEKEDPVSFNRAILGSQGISALAIVGGTRTKFTDEAVCELADEGVTIVTVNREIDHPNVSQILIDNEQGGRLAANHLYDQGVERLWIVAPQDAKRSAQPDQRLAGAQAAASQRGKPEPRVIAFDQPMVRDDRDQVRRAVTEALADDKPDGVFAVGDMYAVSACHALQDKGWRIGQDVYVVGFDGGVYSVCHYPPLTSIRQPMREMGKRAAVTLVRLIESESSEHTQVKVEPALIIRESSGSTDLGRTN